MRGGRFPHCVLRQKSLPQKTVQFIEFRCAYLPIFLTPTVRHCALHQTGGKTCYLVYISQLSAVNGPGVLLGHATCPRTRQLRHGVS